MSALPLLIAELASGAVEIVDLTHTLSPDFPRITLPSETVPSAPFRIEEISHYDARGPAWYWNNFSCGEHTGTHFDAPAHWISGRNLPHNTTDAIPPSRFVGPAAVIDCVAASEADADFLLTVDHILAFEAAHGRIAAGTWVLMHTGWARKAGDPVAFQNFAADGQHTPGPDPECMRFLVEERDILGFGTETIGTDAGQASYLNPPYPAHYTLHGANRYGLQCLANLDLLPPTGAVLIAAPLKIRRGSGSPLRVLALVPRN
ncbi:cyclase family protein [Acuticoccus kandeliae]|uniref:cyclase family protein n=1 Tax=Acuticoccus kandeliae TaxID=2073160 RepID=UPI000D3E740D|nr:cyclase family protein [Acuticoccus kandeliae]